LGGFQSITSWTLLGSTEIPFWEIVCPKNFTLFNQNSHLEKDSLEMFGMLLLIFGIDKDIIDKDHYNLSSSIINTEFMRYMK
jgi:hypothetical protein